MLHDLELLCSVAHTEGRVAYPAKAIAELWERTLLNQFHDILPGSSIVEVYDDAAKDYAFICRTGGELKAKVLDKLCPRGGEGPNLAAVNTLGFARREVVETAAGPALVHAPSMGYAVQPPLEPSDTVKVSKSGTGFILENAALRAELNAQGRLTRLFDKANSRETVPAGGRGNQFVMFDDDPIICDAWDIDINHLEKRVEVGETVSASIAAKGGLVGSVRFRMRLSPKSTLVQTVVLKAEARRLEFECEVDWHESHKFLKVEFPLDVRSEFATYEIQYGHLRRPTHFNTSWDWARFEVPAFRWADLSEPAFGVALLNDSKYGYACHGNLMRLSLLRSAKHPDENADMGAHKFRYALVPHAGGPQAGGIVNEAAAFNQPLLCGGTGAAPSSRSFFSIDNTSIVIDTVKKAEDGDDIIVRLYESSGSRQTATLVTSLPLKAVEKVNLLEDRMGPAVWRNGLKLELKPFEVASYRFRKVRTATSR